MMLHGAPRLASLAFRRTCGMEHGGWAAIKALLAETFGLDFSPFDALDAHDPTATAFSWFDPDGHCIANLSTFALPLIIEGEKVQAYGLQSGAVHPQWRGCGLYKDLTRRVIAHCEAQGAELILLYTGTPALYVPWGFEVIPQHSFVGEAPEPASAASSRRLSLDAPADLALLRRLLRSRGPVSNRFGVVSHGSMFLLNSLIKPDIRLDYIPALDAVIAWSQDEKAFRLFDVVAEQIPALSDLRAAIGAKPGKVEIFFPPDKLDWSGRPHPHEGRSVLMGRGGMLSSISHPAMLPPTAEF